MEIRNQISARGGGDVPGAWFIGRTLYHAAPLHYVPGILCRGELIAASIGQALGIAPRKTAARRDRMLNLNGFVHLALDLETPLLRDKLARGMPHAVFVFDGEKLAATQSCALIPFNTKAWRAKACYELIDQPAEMSALLRRRDQFRRFPSLEVLVEGRLSLNALKEIIVFRPRDKLPIQRVFDMFSSQARPIVTLMEKNGSFQETAQDERRLWSYYAACLESGRVHPFPDLPFD